MNKEEYFKNKEDILKAIKQAEENLIYYKKQLEEFESQEYEPWQPKEDEIYYYITAEGNISNYKWFGLYINREHLKIGNVFKTEQEAEKEVERRKVHTMLKNIALRLNKGEKIDWENLKQDKFYKFYLCFNYERMEISFDTNWFCKGENVYCLSSAFLDVAIKEIGYERLENYLRGEQ